MTFNVSLFQNVNRNNIMMGEFQNGNAPIIWNPAIATVTPLSIAIAPVLTQPIDAIVSKGSTYQTTMVSTQPCHYTLVAGPDDAVIDPLTGAITWSTDVADFAHSMHFGVKADNGGGSDTKFWIIHYGISNVHTVGSGKDYPDLLAAFTAQTGVGTTFVFDDGIYDSSVNHNNHMYQPTVADMSHVPTSGVAGTFNTVIARTPYGVVYDCLDTDAHGIQIHGNTDIEAEEQAAPWNFSNSGSLIAPNTEQEYIKIVGFVVKNATETGILPIHCNNIYLQYCGDIDSGRIATGNVNVSNITFQNSTDCLGEYLMSAGGGRYKFTTYQSKRCAYRRSVYRNDHYQGTEPTGGAVIYRQRGMLTQNVYGLDSKAAYEFLPNTVNNFTGGAFGIAATDARAYPTDIKFQRCMNLNSKEAFSVNDSNDVSDTNDTFQWTDCVTWDTLGRHGITRGGPADYLRLTAGYIGNNFVGDFDFLSAFNGRQTISKSVFTNIGWDGATGADQGHFAYSNYRATGPIDLIDSYLNAFTGTKLHAGDSTAEGYIETNVQSTDPETIGLEYLGRTEAGSQLRNEGVSAENTFLTIGKLGTFHGHPDAELENNLPVLPRILTELIAPHFRAYTHTGPTRTGPTDTLSGDRGFAVTGESFGDYVLGYTGKTPYVYDASAKLSGGDLHVSWQKPAPNYMTNLTGWKVYANGILAAAVDATAHGAIISNEYDITGEHTVTIVAVDSVKGDSGHSYPIAISG